MLSIEGNTHLLVQCLCQACKAWRKGYFAFFLKIAQCARLSRNNFSIVPARRSHSHQWHSVAMCWDVSGLLLQPADASCWEYFVRFVFLLGSQASNSKALPFALLYRFLRIISGLPYLWISMVFLSCFHPLRPISCLGHLLFYVSGLSIYTVNCPVLGWQHPWHLLPFRIDAIEQQIFVHFSRRFRFIPVS